MSAAQNMATDLHEVLRVGREEMGARAAASDWLSALRERSAEAAAGMTLPDRRQEAWRYTPLSFLDKAAYRPAPEAPFDAVQLSDIEELLLDASDALRLVFVNGHLVRALGQSALLPEGVVVASLGGGLGAVPEALQRELGQVAERRNLFAALNGALMSDGALIQVPAGVACERPIELLHISVGLDDPAICHPRHLLVLGEGAHAKVVERYCSLGDATYFNNALVEVALQPGAELVHDRLQEESNQAQHLTDLHVRLGRGSRYRLNHVGLGAAWSRTDVRVLFEGEDAQAELNGLMLAADQQLNDVHLDVQHLVPGCASRETFKGILDGKGKVVFDGRILVARDAQKSDAELANDNLMLSRSAEVDTKPQLEIHADDVKCSHGTTVGELDPAMLFYLRSRGIPAATARQMLCQGFAEAVIAEVENAPLRARIAARLAARLGGRT
jgi:Fe-S cluster assembly protein SufD